MASFMNRLVRVQCAIWMLCSSVLGDATFTNPSGPDNSTTLTIGDQFIVEWRKSGPGNAGYSELSLGLLQVSGGNIFWLLSNVEGYTSQNYAFNVSLGNGIKLEQGNTFEFILVNGTHFGQQALSAEFTIKKPGAAAASSTTSSTSTNNPTSAAITSSPSSTAATSSSSGLSTAAKAGIGAGVAVAVLALLGSMFTLWRHRRQSVAAHKMRETPINLIGRDSTSSSHYSPHSQYSPSPISPTDGYSHYAPPQKNYHEAPGSATLPPMAQVHEAPNQPIYEAP